jgi:hypothetical protein
MHKLCSLGFWYVENAFALRGPTGVVRPRVWDFKGSQLVKRGADEVQALPKK